MADTPYPLPKSIRQTDWLIGTGVTTYGPFGEQWGIFDNADVLIETRDAATGAEVPNAATAEKTSLAERYSPFTITFPVAITAATEYRVTGLRQHDRSLAVTRGGAVDGLSLELELSKQAVVLQEQRRDLDNLPTFDLLEAVAEAEASADAALASRLAAEAAAAAAATIYDNFDDRYLGAKASEPALDNDGNALVVGALFYHTGVTMKQWSGTVWIPTGGTGGLLAANNLSDLPDAETARGNLGLGSGGLAPTGSMVAFAGSAAPSGWLLCDGQAISRTAFAALFAALGTTYGVGDGSTTFNLPDLRGRTIAGKDNMGGAAANRLTNAGSGITGTTLGAVGGGENHTLTIAHLPAHGHPVRTSASRLDGAATGGFLLSSNSLTTQAAFTGTPSDTIGQQIGGTGSGAAHPNVQPTVVLNYIIKT
jgi:microcystin-dependent protein